MLYDGSTVTVYHSKPEENCIKKIVDIQIKTAELLAEYIVKYENIENNSIFYLS